MLERIDLRNEDWLRTRTWDLWVGLRAELHLVSSLTDLFVFLRVQDEAVSEQRSALQRLIALPAAESMPAGLKSAVDEFLSTLSPRQAAITLDVGSIEVKSAITADGSITIDKDLGRTIFSPVCTFCARLHSDRHPIRECDAFDDIPDEIWEGDNLHDKPYSGDRGLQFVLADGVVPGVGPG